MKPERGVPLVLALFGAVMSIGGTCAAPPPWHDVSGGWVSVSSGPALVDVEGVGRVDVDIAMRIAATTPRDRTPLPVTGVVCVQAPVAGALSATYTVDAGASTWAGSDYGGARLDVVARAHDGRVVRIAQAFMHNASPAALDGSIISFVAADGEASGVIRFEDWRRAEVACP